MNIQTTTVNIQSTIKTQYNLRYKLTILKLTIVSIHIVAAVFLRALQFPLTLKQGEVEKLLIIR